MHTLLRGFLVASSLSSFVVEIQVAGAQVAAAAESEQSKQGTKPETWWPTQPRPLPLVHPLFSDDMVLQRELAAPIWGWSTPGDAITVTFDGKPVGKPVGTTATTGPDGRWSTKIGPFPPGGPHMLEIKSPRKSVKLANVLVGDVWLCTGQSNMNWPVRLSKDGAKESEAANNPRIRSFTVNFYPAVTPQKLPPPAKWEVCTPEFAKNFSGVGYFFAREIEQTQQIPIGIIHSSAGATYAETWVSAEALRKKMPDDFPALLDEVAGWAGPTPETRDYFADIEKWVATVDPESARLNYASSATTPGDGWRDIEVPKPWEDAGFAGFDGLAWFRRSVDVPQDWVGGDLRLHLSIVNDVDVVWFNGRLIGCTQIQGGRNYIVPREHVKPGENLLSVAVLNRKGPGGFCSGPSNMFIGSTSPNFAQLIRLAGTWQGKAATKIADIKQPFPEPPVRNYKTITSMYNGMIAPLAPFGIKGALWYQGEANGPRWKQYRTLLPTLIGDWRERFGVGDFPFLVVSLANYNPLQKNPVEPGWAEIRESQWRTTRTVPNVGLAMTIDIGDGDDIHPRNKQEVGRRLGLVARRMAYGEKNLIDSGPEFTKAEVDPANKTKMRLHFKNIGGGLAIKTGETKLTGFVVAGEDKKFAWADAVIEGDTIVVSSPEVPEPKFVRYGWALNPLVNLYNKEGLPAITFRNDE
jgi:sialate O-acetylesterase